MPAAPLLRSLAGATVEVHEDADAACLAAADRIGAALRDAVARRGKAVLGLATGGTPIPVYRRLVAMHRAGEISFRDAVTYNLDEYYPIGPLDPNSYRSYMERHLFAHVDLAPNRAHVLDGTVPEAFADEHAASFDRWIEADGGLDLQLLGIGRNGHIAFNEPSEADAGEAAALPTRVARLHPITIADAAKDFGGEEHVPRRALTMGTRSILSARAILVLAFGPGKAEAVARAITGPVTAACPASLLRNASGRVTWLLDPAAASAIPR